MENQLDSVSIRPSQLPRKAIMVLADVLTYLQKGLLAVDAEPGVIQTHVITDEHFRIKMTDPVIIKILLDAFYSFIMLAGVNLNIHQNGKSSSRFISVNSDGASSSKLSI